MDGTNKAAKADNQGPINLISGSLESAQGVPLAFWPIEVSQLSLTMVTDADPAHLSDVVLTTDERRLRLKQIRTPELYKGGTLLLVQYRATELATNVEELLATLPELKRWTSQRFATEPLKLAVGHMYVRAARFVLDNPLVVRAKTFGTRFQYPLAAHNVSKSGLLLEAEGNDVPPFKQGTLIEIEVDYLKKRFHKPVNCLAKVVRIESTARPGRGSEFVMSRFAVQLIDLDQATSDLWCSYVDEVERALTDIQEIPA